MPPEDIGTTFGPQATSDIVATVLRLRNQVEHLTREVTRLSNHSRQSMFYVGKSNGTITAINGTTLGSGVVDVYRPTSTTGLGEKVFELDVLNAAGAISDDTVVGVSLGAWGKWYVTVENCA